MMRAIAAPFSGRRLRKRQRGSTLVEFALTLPLFFVLVIGMLEYGYWFYVAVSATSAAREGARQCTLVSLGACGDCDPSAAVDYMGAIGLDEYTDADATCENSAGALMYTVDVTVDFPTLTGYLQTFGAIPASDTDGYTLARGMAIMRGQ
jgi:Flp pilus assembly protein TadG